MHIVIPTIHYCKQAGPKNNTLIFALLVPLKPKKGGRYYLKFTIPLHWVLSDETIMQLAEKIVVTWSLQFVGKQYRIR